MNSDDGRRRAAELLTKQPQASLRDVARATGIAPATVLDVRKRLDRGEPPVPGKRSTARTDAAADGVPNGQAPAVAAALAQDGGAPAPAASSVPRPASRATAASNPAATVQKLLRDPSLRNNEQGKGMLRLLQVNAVGTEQLPAAVPAIPPHCVGAVLRLALQYATMWQAFAWELEERARIIDPSQRPA